MHGYYKGRNKEWTNHNSVYILNSSFNATHRHRNRMGQKQLMQPSFLKLLDIYSNFLKNSTSQKLNMLNCIHSDPTWVNSTKWQLRPLSEQNTLSNNYQREKMHLLITSTSEIQLPESNRYGGTFGRSISSNKWKVGC